jgi:hypothetical protein
MSDGAFLVLVLVALSLPLLLAAPAIMARRRIGIPIALVGTVFGAIVFFSARPPVDHGGGVPLGAFDAIGYVLQRGYGGFLLAAHGLTALLRMGLALRESYRPWPDVTIEDEVAAGADLPRARAESCAADDAPG